MGSPAAMRAALQEDVALEWHLQYNHYPPLDSRLIPIAKQVLEHVRSCPDVWIDDEGGEFDCTHKLVLPDGAVFGSGETSADYGDLLEAWHLWEFLSE